jgi:hypothetical protein
MDIGIEPESLPIVFMITPVDLEPNDVTRFVSKLISGGSEVGHWPASDLDREFAIIQMGPPLLAANVTVRRQIRVVRNRMK